MRWLPVTASLLAALVPIQGQTADLPEIQYFIESVAGSNDVGDDRPAVVAQLAAVEGLALDGAGNLYIADNIDHRIRRVDFSTGIITTVAGNGHSGSSGDGGPAALAMLNSPYGLAFDSAGALYVADFGNRQIRKITPQGEIRTIVGDNAPVSARLLGPRNLAVDSSDNLYISDFADHRVYQVRPDGLISIVAGTGNQGFNGDGSAIARHLSAPAGLATWRDGSLYIADSGNNCVRKLHKGILTTVMGGPAGGAVLSQPTGVALDAFGNLYVADSGNRRIMIRDRFGRVRVLIIDDPGLTRARDVAFDLAGKLLVADGGRVVRVETDGSLDIVAGGGNYGVAREDAPALESYLAAPAGVAVDGKGNLYIADEAAHRVRRVDVLGNMATVAGNGEQGDTGDFGLAVSARLVDPVAVAVDEVGNFWIADHLGNRIRRVGRNGVITTVVGDGSAGFSTDPDLASAAFVNRPRGVALDRQGNLYIADSLNHRVRRVDTAGWITTIAGNGVRGYGGDNGLAELAQLDTPSAVALDRAGNLYIADQGNHVIRRVGPGGVITSVAGAGIAGFSGDGGSATAARLDSPASVAVDDLGNLLIADTNNHRIRRVSATGVIDTIAGDGIPGLSGDGGPAALAQLRLPFSVAVDNKGCVYIADLDNRRVRRIYPVYTAPVIVPVREALVVHGASFVAGPIAPGQIISIFGEGIGPEAPAGARLSSSGILSESIGDTEVRVNGVPAPLYYAGGSQVNAQVPYTAVGEEFGDLEVYVAGKLHSRARLQVRPAVPGLFTVGQGEGQAVAVNQDGSLNSMANPAQRGSIVVLFATGEGQTSPGGIEGQPANTPLPKPVLPVHVRIGGLPCEILYAGSAPGFAGLMQVNVRVPSGFVPSGELPVELFVGGVCSQPGVTIAIR